MSALLRELLTAHRIARTTDLATALQTCGIPTAGVPIWGAGFVELDGAHYAPRAGGRPAIIVPVFDGGELVDLTATGLETRRTLTRLGVASVLGQDAIDRAKDGETYVHLFADPIEWLRHRCGGAVVLDWSVARFALADLPAIACATEFLAARIDKELRQPTRVPPLFVREERRAAA
jgi:hypothetical protein